MLQDFLLNTVGPWILNFLHGFPVLAPLFIGLIFIQGICRFLFKPLMGVIDNYVKETPSKTDDSKWAAIKESKWYKVVLFIVDWLMSVKLPQ